MRAYHVPQGRFANVFVPDSHDRFGKLCEWAKEADQKWWKFGKSSDGRNGIWIPYNVWQEGVGAIKRAEAHATMTADEIRRHYGKHDLAFSPKDNPKAKPSEVA
jgi:hypothetical protein